MYKNYKTDKILNQINNSFYRDQSCSNAEKIRVEAINHFRFNFLDYLWKNAKRKQTKLHQTNFNEQYY